MKKLYQIIRQSSKAILRNKGRSFLTILGIIIGIGSVIALISLGNGVKVSISGQISTLGTNNLTITPGQTFASTSQSSSNSSSQSSGGGGFGGRPGGGGNSGFVQAASTLTTADLTSLSDRAKHPEIEAVTGNVSGSAIFSAGGTDERFSVVGTNPNFLSIRNLAIAKGSFITDGDVSSHRLIAVVGNQFAHDVFGTTDAVGKTLTINGQTFTVTGVLATAAENSFTDFNSQVYIPYSTAMDSFNTQSFSNLTAEATSSDKVDDAKTDITNTLLANHKITDSKLADFSVLSSKDLLSAVSNITGVLTSLLAGIAAISLVVGGIGIMNIMLVSVTERTREIGLRKALGAKTSDILGQFVTEAIMLTLTGGLLGIGLGKLIGTVAAHFLKFHPIVTPGAIILAVGVSSAVGLVFGIYPAAKAARLNPIDALRYE